MSTILNLCCPEGYTYLNNAAYPNGTCISPAGTYTSTIPCACCPKGYTFVDSNGYFLQSNPLFPGYGTVIQISNTLPYDSSIINNCVYIVNGTFAVVGSNTSSVTCPCCAEGQWYNSYLNMCVDGVNNLHPSIPCIECVCPTITIPTCTTCQESDGLHINFTFNPFAKHCTDCSPQDFTPPYNEKLNAFMPYFIILPNTNNFTSE